MPAASAVQVAVVGDVDVEVVERGQLVAHVRRGPALERRSDARPGSAGSRAAARAWRTSASRRLSRLTTIERSYGLITASRRACDQPRRRQRLDGRSHLGWGCWLSLIGLLCSVSDRALVPLDE